MMFRHVATEKEKQFTRSSTEQTRNSTKEIIISINVIRG